MGSWIDGLTEEQKRQCGLLPEQMRERFTKQLAILRDPKQATPCRENRELQGALNAAIRRLDAKGRKA
jgi:hypothetical protein